MTMDTGTDATATDSQSVTGQDSFGSLEAEAKKRRERLHALKNKRRLIGDLDSAGAEDKQQGGEDSETGPKRPTFRSYEPQSDDIGARLPAAATEALEDHIEEQLSRVNDTDVTKEIDLTTLAPRKIDWDLKRDVQKKLDKLERRTQRAIAEIIRERIATGKQELLYTAVKAAAESQERARFSDDDDD